VGGANLSAVGDLGRVPSSYASPVFASPDFVDFAQSVDLSQPSALREKTTNTLLSFA
jgi:hypothetical protein